jgi:hypothetical protein
LLELINSHTGLVLPTSGEIDRLTDLYIKAGIITERFRLDAEHIATASVMGIDFVVSYNMGHISKQKTMIATAFVNLDKGYKNVVLCTPTEVLDYDTGRKGRRASG